MPHRPATMNLRIAVIALVVVALAGLIAWSQLWPEPNKVSGFIEADEIRVGSRIGGRVLKVHVEEGDQVSVGDVLLELEPFDLNQREDEARQALAAREAEFQRLMAGYRPEEIAQAKARRDQLQARLDLLVAGPRQEEKDAAKGRLRVAQAEQADAKTEHTRRQDLVNKRAISQEEFDTAIQRLAAAEANVIVRQRESDLLEAGTRPEEIREAEAKLEEAAQAWHLASKGYRQEEKDSAKAARDAAQAALDVIREQQKELTIKSPVQGAVEALDLQAGDLVAAGAPVLSLMDDQRMWVRAYVPQNKIAVHPGERLRVSVDSFPHEKLEGEVIYLAREAEFTPNNVQTPEERSKQVYRVKVLLKSGLDKVRPGMTADVWLAPLGAAS